MRNRVSAALAILFLAAFLYGLMRIALLPLETGEAYPPYSSLRADPLGTMALYESLARLPELKVERNFQPLHKLKGVEAAVFLMGETALGTRVWSEEELKELESIAGAGARVVIAFLPAPPQLKSALRASRSGKLPPIEKRWGIRVEVREAKVEEVEEAGSMPKETAARLVIQKDSGWQTPVEDEDPITLAERPFGKGSIVLLTESYVLSNESLRLDRDVETIRLLVGSFQRVVFDESHLNVVERGSVGGLIRRYRLTGAAAMALLLGLLFVWKNSTSLLPPVAESAEAIATGSDARSGMVKLLKRSVPRAQLVRVCWDRWKETRGLGRPVSDVRVARAERELNEAAATTPSPALYLRLKTILTERT